MMQHWLIALSSPKIELQNIVKHRYRHVFLFFCRITLYFLVLCYSLVTIIYASMIRHMSHHVSGKFQMEDLICFNCVLHSQCLVYCFCLHYSQCGTWMWEGDVVIAHWRHAVEKLFQNHCHCKKREYFLEKGYYK